MKEPLQLKSFFEQYGAISLGNEPQRLADFYAESFVVADPEGNAAFDNDDAFVHWLDGVADKNREYGLREMQVMAISEFPVNRHYRGATVTWGARFEKTGADLIEFNITYILSLLASLPKIIMYISEESQGALMKAKGLL